ncbi:MAG TPA: LamG domain-containing protein [Puia sp.]|nr:LamG domain-containing protein [Puia sp.]
MNRNLLTAGLLSLCFVFFVFYSCTKNTNPAPPVHDTVTVVKYDTTYATKPDSTVNLKKGLLVYLPFDGNIADSSGNGNPTTAVGSVLTADSHGWVNQAFGATSAGQRIYVTNNGSIQFDTAYSLSFGFMVNSNQQQSYVSFVNTADGTGPTFTIGTTYAGVNAVDWGAEDISLGCSGFGGNDNVNLVDTANFLPVPGSWYNLIAIYHRGTVQIFVNGTLISTKIGVGTKANLCPTAKMVIGAWWDGQPLSMNGKLDNIRLYNRVLTSHEIVALASNYQVTSNSLRPGPKKH